MSTNSETGSSSDTDSSSDTGSLSVGSTFKVIVVGVDDSETAKSAADRAAELALIFGARLHLVSAIKSGKSATVEGPGGDTWFLDDADDATTMLTQLSARWPNIEVSLGCPVGKPAAALVEEAVRESADLIVVGNRRVQGIARVLGAVASEVTHHAPCDVLVVKTNV